VSSSSFGHCIVCLLLLLAIVLCVFFFFWPMYRVSSSSDNFWLTFLYLHSFAIWRFLV
jgi:uncharacterized membrane protein YqjE